MEEVKESAKKKSKSTPVEEIKLKKKRRSKGYLFLYVAIFGFTVYAAFTIISQHLEINEKRAQRDELYEQIEIMEIKNDDLKRVKHYSGKKLDDYIGKIAREDLDYIKNGERVFINVSGD